MKNDQRILEQNQRFSDSHLWQMQQTAYTSFGPQAWSEKGVPFYLTSNPLTAKKYAMVVLGYLKDCLSINATTPLNLSEPFYIFDLGAGTGRFGYLFLKNLFHLIKGLPLEQIKICYVMTDIVQSNIDFWKKHPLLQQYLENGRLDFAYYHHASEEKSLDLIYSKKNLNKNSLINPIVLIGNYFFDTIPQDLFFIKEGVLHEGRVTIKTNHLSNNSIESIIRDMECTYDYIPIQNVDDYYSDFPELHKILKEYMLRFDNIPFLFPIGAFYALRYFLELSKNRLLLLAGDQGVVTEEQISNWGEPNISRHGSFSIAVSYHAIAHFFRNLGGWGFLTKDSDPLYVVIAGIAGGSNFPETNLAFCQHIDSFEPKDYWNLAGAIIDQNQNSLPLETILTLIKFGNWDPMNFHAFFENIRRQIPQASQSLKNKLLRTIHLIYENFYPVSKEEGNFVMNLGVLCYDMRFYSDALVYFERSLSILGESKQIYMNMSACYRALQDQENAIIYTQETSKLGSVSSLPDCDTCFNKAINPLR